MRSRCGCAPIGTVAAAVMGKQPVPGLVKTRLCPPLSPTAAAGLAEALLWDAIDRIGRIPQVCPAVAFDPPEAEAYFRSMAGPPMTLVVQHGLDLGERMHHLLSRLLENHAAALVLGSDLPSLPGSIVAEAVTRLRDPACDVVIGPAMDGGYYAIGLRQPRPALFADMPWSTPAVLRETLRRADREGLRLHLLPPWFDVDTVADLDRLRSDERLRDAAPRTAACLTSLFPPASRER